MGERMRKGEMRKWYEEMMERQEGRKQGSRKWTKRRREGEGKCGGKKQSRWMTKKVG